MPWSWSHACGCQERAHLAAIIVLHPQIQGQVWSAGQLPGGAPLVGQGFPARRLALDLDQGNRASVADLLQQQAAAVSEVDACAG